MRTCKLIAAAMLAMLAAPATAQQERLPAPASGAPQMTKADVEAWLDGFMPYALKRGDIAGAVVVVVKDGQVLAEKGYGYADVARHKPVDPQTTLFRPGSVSKLLTWTAVMQLVEQGKLGLDADVNAYLDFKIPPRDGKPITLRNIMTHTAGFEESVNGVIVLKAGSILPLGEALKRWTPVRIFAPGATPAYSNYATGLAGYIVERASGMSFDDYVDKHIFAPTGMTRSSFRQPLPAHLQPLVSKGYLLGSGEPEAYEFVNPAPAGSLAATGADMAKFMIAHLNDGGALLRPETARAMHRATLDILPPLNRMALGFYEQNINGRAVIAHNGGTFWFYSYLWLFPDEGIGMFVSLNSAGKDGASGAIQGALFQEFADRYLSAPDRDGHVDATTAAEHAKMLAGTFISSRRSETNFLKMSELVGQLEIGLDEEGGIAIAADAFPGIGGAQRKWVEIAPFVWRDTDSHERLAAQVVDGEVVRMSFDSASAAVVFDRAPWYRSTAWLLPTLLASLGALALTALFWPVAAIVRRHYGATLALADRDLMAYRLVCGFAAAAVAVLVGWVIFLTETMHDSDNLDGSLDQQIWALQIAGAIAFFGLMGAVLWNARRVWTGKRGWFSKLWSVGLVLAAVFTLWTALVFNIISFDASF